MIIIEYTKSKISSVIELVDNLQADDFPHTNAPIALGRIRELLNSRLSKLDNLHADTDKSAIIALCKESLHKIFTVFPLLGFLVRSADVRNSFELHGPFLRLVRRVLGEDARLIISSEWEFSPFTYQMPDDLGLDDIVFIGIPASESCNGLAIPLAGHEFGHNIWRRFNFNATYTKKVEGEVVRYISEEIWDEFVKYYPDVGDKEKLEDMLGRQFWQASWIWAMNQIEELFCDFIGLLIFKEAYLYAFSYLLAPGLPGARSVSYPNMIDRIKALTKVAGDQGIRVSSDYVDEFEDSTAPALGANVLLLNISDAVTKSFIDELASDAKSIIEKYNLDQYSPSNTKDLTHNFSVGIPAIEARSISNVVNAAWAFYRDQFPSWERRYPMIYSDSSRRNRMLSDLMFKSLEVLEIAERQDGD